jgi:hypothetical protein
MGKGQEKEVRERKDEVLGCEGWWRHCMSLQRFENKQGQEHNTKQQVCQYVLRRFAVQQIYI